MPPGADDIIYGPPPTRFNPSLCYISRIGVFEVMPVTHAIRQLIMPVSMKGWLLILPYALLVPLLLVRDGVQLWLVRRTAKGRGAFRRERCLEARVRLRLFSESEPADLVRPRGIEVLLLLLRTVESELVILNRSHTQRLSSS